MSRPKGSKNKSKKPTYALTLGVNGERQTVVHESVEQAILGLPIPKVFATRAVFTLEHNGKISRPVTLPGRLARRLLDSGLTGQIQRSVLMKRLTL